MTQKLLLAVSILLVLAMVVLGADAITGKWVYDQPMGRGGGGGGGGGGGMPPMQVTLDLKADGANLTGTLTMPAFGGGGGGGGAATPTPITNGKVSGNSITFDVTREGRNGTTTQKFEGTVSGNEMQLKITRDTQNGPMTQTATAKRSTT